MMTRSTWVGSIVYAVAMAIGGVASATTIGFIPGSQIASVGDTVTVEIVVSELAGEVVSAYDLDVRYDSSILSATSVSFGAQLGDPTSFQVFNDFNLSIAGVVDLAQLSLRTDPQLLALQGGNSFVLATVGFDIMAPGVASLEFLFDAINNVTGTQAGILEVSPTAGSISATDQGGSSPIPEPTSAMLFAVGATLVGVAVRRRSPR